MSTIALDHRSVDHPARPARHLSAVPDLMPTLVLRLTRRGKVVLLSAAVVAVAILVIMLGSSTAASNHAGTPVQTTVVTVLPGQTLWQIAAAANPNGDIRSTVDDIVRLNSLPNASALQLGSEIAVPVYK